MTETLPTDAVLVRPMREGDRSGWQQLWVSYHAQGPQGGPPPPESVTQRTWDRFFQEHEPMEALLAEQHGRPVGFVLETNATAMRLYDRIASRSGHVVYRKDF